MNANDAFSVEAQLEREATARVEFARPWARFKSRWLDPAVNPDLVFEKLSDTPEVERLLTVADLNKRIGAKGFLRQSLEGRLMALEAMERFPGDTRLAPTLRALRESLPDHSRTQIEVLRQFGAELAGSPEYAAGRAQWTSLDTAGRTALLQGVIARYSALVGVTPPRLVLFDEPIDDDGFILRGRYENGVVYLNTNPKSFWPSVDGALSSVLHETTHHWQAGLAQRATALPRGGIDTYLARVFRANGILAGTGIYVTNADRKAYEAQPIERNARLFPELIRQGMAAAHSRRALRAEPRPRHSPRP